jgi:hypothetical protein
VQQRVLVGRPDQDLTGLRVRTHDEHFAGRVAQQPGDVVDGEAVVTVAARGIWKKLNASALSRLAAIPSPAPHTIEMSSTPRRKTTPSETGSATSASGYRISVSTATSATAATTPAASGGRRVGSDQRDTSGA